MGNWIYCCCVEEDIFMPIEKVYVYRYDNDNENESGISTSKWETKLSKRK